MLAMGPAPLAIDTLCCVGPTRFELDPTMALAVAHTRQEQLWHAVSLRLLPSDSLSPPRWLRCGQLLFHEVLPSLMLRIGQQAVDFNQQLCILPMHFFSCCLALGVSKWTTPRRAAM